MTLQDILSVDSGRQRRKRVGRGIGSGRGKTCGRGHKGAYARTGGGGVGMLYEGGQFPLWQRLPRRGFSNFAHTTRYQAVRLGWAVERIEGDITLDALVAAGLARPGALVKLVSGGEVTVPKGIKVAVHAVTGSVKSAVEAAGGSVESLHA